jgi:hypothetical protein
LKPAFTTPTTALLYNRIIALWVINEAILGGIIHGFRLPVSGLIVGSGSVICISLIAWFAPARGAIIKATLIVAIFKMMLSPHSPLPAYFAVFFQGMLGELLFHKRKYFRAACILFAVIAMLESGLQRILTLTIIYGNNIWKVINEFFNNLTGQHELTDYSFFIIVCYVLFHTVIGCLIGVWAGTIPLRIKLMGNLRESYPVNYMNTNGESIVVNKKKRRTRIFLFAVWILLIVLWAQSEFNIGTAWLPASLPLHILIRSTLVILTWVFVISPVLKMVLEKWLQKKKQESLNEVQTVLALLPQTQQLVSGAWNAAGAKKGIGRLNLTVKIILANIFYEANVVS